MKFDVVLLHNSKKRFNRYNSSNGFPAISSNGLSVIQPDKNEKEIVDNSLFEVAIGDFIIETVAKDGTSYVTVYNITDINEDFVTGSPC